MQKDSAGFLVGFLLVFSGCLSANFTPTSGNLYQPRPSDCDIEVFSSGPPDRAYVEVGVVEGKGTAWKAEFRDLLPAIMEEGVPSRRGRYHHRFNGYVGRRCR